MRSRLFIVLPIFGLIFRSAVMAEPVFPPPQPIHTLADVYRLALANSERIAVSAQAVREAEALYRQTLGDSLPYIGFNHETSWEDRSSSRRALQPASESEGRLELRSTDLTGYRELAALKARKAVVRQFEHERKRIEQLLFSDVAAAFYGLLQAQENAATTERLGDLADRRLRELRERVRVGRSRGAESVGQEFQITTLQSQLEEARRLTDARRDLLAFLAAAPIGEIGAPEEAPSAAPVLETYLARAEQRPDVRAAQERAAAARTAIRVARADYFPRLSLDGNYYLYRPDATDDIDWDAAVNVGLPLWTWGANRATVDVVRAVAGQADEIAKATRRQADLEIRNAHRDFLSTLRQFDLKRRGVELARRDYELQVRDDRRGLVTSLEVLESLNRLNSAELDFTAARLAMRLASLNLDIVAGAVPEEILK